jgi:hypothetical protein
MISQVLRKIPLVLVIVAFSAFTLPAGATLGGSVASVQDDQASMKGTLQVTKAEGYEIHEIQAAQGVKVREYVSPSGTVFGVAWQGPWKPNLHQILGSYFDQYVQAASANKRARGPAMIQLPELVVQSAGHQGAFAGRAYLPQMIPQGTSISAIK